MTIRRANENDIPRLIELLEQVLQIHADIRPDIFIPGTTKYTNEELTQMIKDDTKPIYVAADENDNCLGYAFARIEMIYNHIHDEEVGIVPCVFNGISDVQLVCLEKYRLI